MDRDFCHSSQDEDELQLTDISNSIVHLSPGHTEVELVQDSGRPSTTGELVGMLKNAGTDLTVKYLTGTLSFEEFCLELDKKKLENQAALTPPVKTTIACESGPSPSTSMESNLSNVTRNVPNFDQLFNEDVSEDDGEGDEEDMSDVQSDFLDDGRDSDWIPDDNDKKSKTGSKRKQDSSDGSSPVKKRRKRRKPSDLPKHLVREQGKAMLLRAQGKTEQAIMLLYDIINKAPRAAAPYLALGSIHEEKGDMKQALKFFLVAANLQKPPPKEWFELIELCMKLNDPKLAQTCFVRALKNSYKKEEKYEVHMYRSLWYEKQDEPMKALQCQELALAHMNKFTETDKILNQARTVAQEYLKLKNKTGAIDTLTFIHKELPLSIDAEDIHLLVELLMSQQSYDKSLEILVQHCGVKISFINTSGEVNISQAPENILNTLADVSKNPIERIDVPALMPMDLKSKLVQSVCFLKILRDLSSLKEVIHSLTSLDVDDFGDVQYDVAETMVECGYHDAARPILQNLVSSQTYSKAEVWMTYAHCLNALGKIQAAADSYRKVIELAPNHYPARVTLSTLQQQMGHNEEALELLSQGPSGEDLATSDQLLLLHKCQLLYSQGRMEMFINCGRRLLSFNMRGEYSPDFIKILLAIKRTKSRKRFFPDLTGKKSGTVEVPDEITELEKAEKSKFKEDMWDVYLKLVKILYDKDDHALCLKTSVLGITCPAFCEDEAKIKAAEFLCIKIGRINQSVYNLARNLVGDEKMHNQAWNLFSFIIIKSKEFHDLRFALRALMKDPHSLPLGMLNGNSRLISGSYKLALGEYLSVFRQSPNDLSVLCCALCLLHITSQKYTARKNVLIPQVLCLLNVYKEMRGECQETYYNIARALYQINLHYASIHYYKRALKFPPVVSHEHGVFDLSREIAFNLSQIYKKSGNYEVARYYIEKYCVI